MDIEQAANDAYYNQEEPLITDEEFGLLSDTGLEIVNFRNKTEHNQPMGSLKKIKTEEDFNKWVSGNYKVTPKLDGNSIELVFKNGNMIKAITRGDGFVGNDITDKVKFCNYKIQDKDGSYKCEGIMDKKHQKDYEKNIRNVVAGALGRKSVDVDELQKIHILCFDDLVPQTCLESYNELEEHFLNYKSDEYPYAIDGLVIELCKNVHEENNDLLPANKIALKFNKDGVDAEVGHIEWSLGKHSRLTPVLVLASPVEIDGTNVQRVSASNYGILNAAGLNVGAKVKVIKSGDIIPYISEVVAVSENQLMLPECPECGVEAEISENGIHATCPNDECESKVIVNLQHVFSVFDLEYISDTTIEKLFYEGGFVTLREFFTAKEEDFANIPGFGKSKTNNVIAKLKSLKLTESQVLECAMVKGISSSQSKKLIEHFGTLENFIYNAPNTAISDIEGFGTILEETIHSNMSKFREVYSTFKNCNVEIIVPVKQEVTGQNIVFTGTCSKYGRKELSKILEERGHNVQSGIKKDTDLLLTDDVDSKTSKTTKAKALNVKIMSYEDFFVQET